MDWATFFKDYPAVIPAVTTLVGLVFGYLFGKWDSERKRKWEVEDREFNRRIQYRDSKIGKVQAYLDTYLEAVRVVAEFEGLMCLGADFDESRANFDKLPELLLSTTKWVNGFAALNDSELNYAHDEFKVIFDAEFRMANELLDIVENNQFFDKDITRAKVLLFQNLAITCIGVMQSRIHVLAETA